VCSSDLTQALMVTGALDEDTMHLMATGEVSGALPEMLSRAATILRQETDQKRRMALRVAGILMGVLWLVGAGALVLFGVRTYFDFVFRAAEWFTE
jgi:type II secretory pathway component PulF